MCQTKSQGGRRCAGKGKGSSFFPPSLEEGLGENEYICPKCGKAGSRGTVHSCLNKNLVSLSPFQAKLTGILNEAGIKPVVTGEEAREAMLARFNGTQTPQVSALYVDSTSEQLTSKLSKAGLDAEYVEGSIKVTDADGNAVLLKTNTENSPYSIDTLRYDPQTGEVIDTNGGLADLRDGVIRHTEPFKDNPASVLRGAVLAAQTGYSVAPETLAEASKVADLYESIPKEQVWRQWEDLSLSKTPSKALTAIHEMGWEKNFPELAAIRGVPQSPFWHPEGPVEVHTGQAADIASRKAEEDGLNAEDRSVVVLAAISHDLGKSESTVIDEDGKISSAGHEYTGHKLSKKFLRGIGASAAVKRQVPLIVYSHMCHAQPPTEKAVRRLMTKLDNEGNGTTIEMWARVAEADKAGRGVAGTFGVREEFLEAAEKIRIKDAKPPKTFIDGKFLTGLGYKPGEQYRDMLHAAKNAYENGEASNEAEMGDWLKKNFPM
jgi:tRNA nucleotidyltransferase (CCA-adding enzyme)